MSFVDDLVKNTKNAIEDAKRLQAVIAPAGGSPAPATPIQPARTLNMGGLSLSNPLVIVGGIVAAVVLWKILKK